MTNPVPGGLPAQRFQVIEDKHLDDDLADTPTDRGDDIKKIEGAQQVDKFYKQLEHHDEIVHGERSQ